MPIGSAGRRIHTSAVRFAPVHPWTATGSTTEFKGGFASYGYDQSFRFNSGIVVPAGSTLYCSDVDAHPELTVTGYYAH